MSNTRTMSRPGLISREGEEFYPHPKKPGYFTSPTVRLGGVSPDDMTQQFEVDLRARSLGGRIEYKFSPKPGTTRGITESVPAEPGGDWVLPDDPITHVPGHGVYFPVPRKDGEGGTLARNWVYFADDQTIRWRSDSPHEGEEVRLTWAALIERIERANFAWGEYVGLAYTHNGLTEVTYFGPPPSGGAQPEITLMGQ